MSSSSSGLRVKRIRANSGAGYGMRPSSNEISRSYRETLRTDWNSADPLTPGALLDGQRTIRLVICPPLRASMVTRCKKPCSTPPRTWTGQKQNEH